MRFHLSEEQRAIQDAVRGTLSAEWPIARLHQFADDERDFDAASWRALSHLGVFGILAADSGMGLVDAALVSEAVGIAAGAGPVIAQMIAVAALTATRNAAARAHLDALTSGERIATLAIGSDLVQSAHAADLFVVNDGRGGLRLIVAGEGVEIAPVTATDRSRPVSRVTFGSQAKSLVLFAPGDPMVARLFDAALVLIAADAMGGAQHCTDVSVAYAKERQQFGQPIGRFQALKHQLAHMALDVESARSLVWYAAYAWDAELADSERTAALAKAHLCEVFTRATRAAIAAHGGIGYTWEYGLNYWFRRSVLDRVWLGSPSAQRARAAQFAGW